MARPLAWNVCLLNPKQLLNFPMPDAQRLLSVQGAVWVSTLSTDDDLLGRLGDARDAADRLAT